MVHSVRNYLFGDAPLNTLICILNLKLNLLFPKFKVPRRSRLSFDECRASLGDDSSSVAQLEDDGNDEEIFNADGQEGTTKDSFKTRTPNHLGLKFFLQSIKYFVYCLNSTAKCRPFHRTKNEESFPH